MDCPMDKMLICNSISVNVIIQINKNIKVNHTEVAY